MQAREIANALGLFQRRLTRISDEIKEIQTQIGTIRLLVDLQEEEDEWRSIGVPKERPRDSGESIGCIKSSEVIRLPAKLPRSTSRGCGDGTRTAQEQSFPSPDQSDEQESGSQPSKTDLSGL